MIMGSYLPLNNFRNSIPRTLYGCHGQMRQKATLHTFFFIWNPSPHVLARNDIRSYTRLFLKLEINFFWIVFFESLKNTRIIFSYFSKQNSYSPIHFVKKLKTNFKTKIIQHNPSLWSFQKISSKPLTKKICENINQPWKLLMLHSSVLRNSQEHFYGTTTN